MEINTLVESRLKSYSETGDRLRADWAEVIGKVNEARVKKGDAPLDAHMERNLAIVFENAAMDTAMKSKGGFLFETTNSSNINFLGIQLPIIAAMLPTSILSEVATIQALERRSGSVFYQTVKAGTTKDGITAGDTLISPKTGHARPVQDRTYGSQIGSQNVGTVGVAAVAATLTNLPVKAGSVSVVSNNEIFVDDGNGNMISNAVGAVAGTIVYATGVLAITFTSAPTVQPVASYTYKYETATAPTTGVIVPEVNFDITAETLTAIDFTLQSKFTLAALIDLKKAHGMDLESEIVRILGGELKFAQDHYGIDKMYAAATDAADGAGSKSFDATVGAGQEFVWRKYQFNDTVEAISNAIFSKTLRGVCTFLICGNNVARLIKQLGQDFKPAAASKTPTGPHKIGTLNGRDIFQDPFLPAGTAIAGYKGDSFLQAGLVWAPYIPLTVTPTLTTSDLVSQKGFLSSAAYKIVNPGLFGQISVTGLL
jgi:hypothetical protein